jgi:serine/threonine protein kinase
MHLLGEGASGRVYAARHWMTGAEVAIKVLVGDRFGGVALLAEARLARRVRHPNVVAVLDSGRLPDGGAFLVMERLAGETLEDRFRQGLLGRAEARRLVRELCAALDAVHRAGVVHRDLKPGNLFLTGAATAERHLKLLDFGAARRLGARSPIERTAPRFAEPFVGTPAFMAPEQCLGGPVDHRADLYALGVTLYQLFTGQLPFRGSTLSAIIHQHTGERPMPPSHHLPVPEAVDRLVLACLEKDPGRRPRSAADVARWLDAALARPEADAARRNRTAPRPPLPARA